MIHIPYYYLYNKSLKTIRKFLYINLVLKHGIYPFIYHFIILPSNLKRFAKIQYTPENLTIPPKNVANIKKKTWNQVFI